MKAELVCPIPVHRIAVFAEMAWLERRPELGVLCRSAQDNHNQISVPIVQAVVPSIETSGAHNVIAWCRMLGLCDAGGVLTSLGQDVAQKSEAPVPEQGVFGLWLAQHPLLGRRILSADRMASTKDARFDDITDLPFEPEYDRVFTSVLRAQDRFILRKLPTHHGQNGCVTRSTSATCRLLWTLDFANNNDSWRLEGALDMTDRALTPLSHEPESAGIHLRDLANFWGITALAKCGKWKASEQRLAVSLQSLSAAEQDSFCKTLRLPEIEVPGKGRFQECTLSDVPIGPVSANEASAWALARFERKITQSPLYLSRSDVWTLYAELTVGTPLESFRPGLPAHDELLDRQKQAQNSEVFWSLAAPVDLALVAPDQADLDALPLVPQPAASATDAIGGMP